MTGTTLTRTLRTTMGTTMIVTSTMLVAIVVTSFPQLLQGNQVVTGKSTQEMWMSC